MASSSSTPSQSKGKGPMAWSWWDEVEAGPSHKGGGARTWKCKLCDMTRVSGIPKVKAHFLHEHGQEVRFCPNVTPEKRNELQERVKAQMVSPSTRKPNYGGVDPSLYGVGSHIGSTPSFYSASRSSSPIVASDMGISSMDSRQPSRVQSSLPSRWEPKRKDDVDEAIARFFFHDHIAFNAARSPYFRSMVKKIAEYGSSYTPPSSEYLRTTLLQKEKKAIEQATTNTRALWQRNGVTLIADGWSDTRSRSIHGIVAYSRGDVYFISSHDASSTGKSADVLASEWSEAVEYVGPQNVIHFVADGEASNRAAGQKLRERYPHITFSACMSHCMNNLLKDIGKLPWISPVIEKGNKIVMFVLRHHFVLAEFRKRSDKDLLKYSETRFAYNFLMLERLVTCSSALKQLFVSDEFENSHLSRTEAGRFCRDECENRAFWDDVRHIVDIVQPIVKLLRVTDGMQPCIGKIYEGMDKMVESLASIENNSMRYNALKGLCQDRWQSYHSSMHAAAFVVDPEFQGCFQEADCEVQDGWDEILFRLVPDSSGRRKVKDQLSLYRTMQGKFGTSDAQQDRKKVAGALWWEDYGSQTPELQQLAIKILSQGISSSCLEQLWSSFSHIASKKRNRLGTQRVNDLVFVTANLRLLSRTANAEVDSFVKWKEDSDVDSDEAESISPRSVQV